MNFESIHNYYERLVLDEIMRTLVDKKAEPSEELSDMLQDVACVALNALPARYVRHDVDMAFYLSTREREEMEKNISQAVADAYELVYRYRQNKNLHPEA